ncbi:MAG TPA: ABC transporter permease [Gemmatimonadaceae bacterium]|nr:ABC transporter permease [Gemmatimonadaceae bacterium]
MRNPLLFLRRRRRPDADFAEEIAAHLELEADRLVAEGLSRREAVHEAHRRFGNIGLVQEDFHRRRTIGWMEAIPQQLRRGARRLVRAPLFSITATLTIALGIGATTAVFSLVNGVLLRPLPFAHPDRLVDISHSIVLQGLSHVDQSDATYLYYRRANHVFTDVGAYRAADVNLSAVGSGDAARARRVEAARASASLFGVLGVAPMRGRVFRDDEDLPGAIPVAIIAERLWQEQYASDPGIVGSEIMVDGVVHEVIGVMPRSFAFPDEGTALWVPIGIDPANTKTAAFDYRAVGRLRPGMTPAAAAADLARLLPKVPEAFPGRLTANAIALTHMEPVVRPLRDVLLGGVGDALWVILGAAAFLLLIACANVANLFLVRAEERQHELAVRRALGAGRGVIVAEFFSEGVSVAVLGGVLGVALAVAGIHALRSMPSGIAIPRLGGVGVDGTVLAAAAGATLLTAFIMSVVPALRSYGAGGASVLVQTSRSATAGRSRHRTRRVFVVVQVALALVLITGAGLMARSFQALRSVNPGFDTARSYTFRVQLPNAAYPASGSVVGYVTRALDEISRLPGVQAAGAISKVPLETEARQDTAVFMEGKVPAGGMGQAMPDIHQVAYATPGSFSALGIPIIEGRSFDVPDASRAPLQAIVTSAFARRYWGDEPAVGRRVRFAPVGPWFTVIGVTGDVHGTRLDEPPDETVYLPLVIAPGPAMANGGADSTRWSPRELAFVVRSSAAPHDATLPVERTLRSLAPAVPVYGVRSMEEVVDRSTARTSFTMGLLEIASLTALVIGEVGLYGVVSYMVSLREREIAVRMALGAQPGALRRRVLGEAMAVAVVGIVVGLGVTLLSMRVIAALLFEVAPNDAATLAGAVAVMGVVALAASWIPARRAAAVDPATTLRTDI